MRTDGDRREQARLEVVGALWGSLETHTRALAVNISEDGALLLSPISLSPNTIHTVETNRDGHVVTIEVRVRHSRPTPEGMFQVGVEFLTHHLPFHS
jgi:hypothetical protein